MLKIFSRLALAGGLALLVAGSTQAQTIDRLVVVGGSDVTSLASPDVFTFIPDRTLAEHVQDPLFRTDDPAKITPWLATGYKEIDPLTLELNLRQGVTFSNGEPFNSETVKYYFETILDPKKGNYARLNVTWVDRAEIVDEYTVRLISKEPYPQRLKLIASLYMMPPKYIAEVGWEEFRKKPIGTGPYEFVEHVRDSHVLLKARDNWWGGPVNIREIYYRPINEAAARAAAVVAGEADIAFDLPPEMISLIEGSGRAKIKGELSTRTFLMQMNNTSPSHPGKNPKFREAVDYALDRKALNEAILAGTSAPASFWSPWTFGLDPDIKPIEQDVERAKKALADAGYPNGIDVVLDTSNGQYVKDKELAEAIAGQLTAVGNRTKVQTYEWGVLNQRRQSKNMGDLYLMAWNDVRSDPEVPNTRVLPTGAIWSLNAFPELDALIAKISVEADPEKRAQLIRDQQRYMRDNNSVAFLLYMGQIVAVSDRMSWWEPTPTERHFFPKKPQL